MMSIKNKYLLVFAISVLHFINAGAQSDSEITCKDENGKSVDWFYLYKLPGRFGVNGISKGRLYLYFSSNSLDTTWRLSNKTVGDLDSVTGHTIAQAFVGNETVSGNNFRCFDDSL